MKYEARNYWNFDHKKVNKRFLGKLTYMGDLSIKGSAPVAVYKSAKPNKKKGHKKYMLLRVSGDSLVVSGMTPRQMTAHRHAVGVFCVQCRKVLVSLHRHNFVSCGCPNEAFVDGGADYMRRGAKSMIDAPTCLVDLLTGKVL